MNVALNAHARKLLKQAIADGRYTSESDALNDAVLALDVPRLLTSERVKSAVAEGLGQLNRGDRISIALTDLPGFFQAIKRNGRKRRATKKQ
ncbi:MAG: hypothetical protein FJX59_03220 [Alphaproteobacteria bacterium]|nr:hypothetical protein [Alphaproteobacteria bacterium]